MMRGWSVSIKYLLRPIDNGEDSSIWISSDDYYKIMSTPININETL